MVQPERKNKYEENREEVTLKETKRNDKLGKERELPEHGEKLKLRRKRRSQNKRQKEK